MKILFIGTVQFSLAMLEELIYIGANVVGIITATDSGINADYADLALVGECQGIPLRVTDDINSAETLEWIASTRPHVIFCLGWSRLLKRDLLNAAPLGVVGYHPAALPRNRGRHPLIWTLALGLTETASTFFLMDEGADSGDILSQQTIRIAADDDARSLYDKMVQIARAQLGPLVHALTNGTHKPMPQDHTLANVWRKRGIRDGEIDWRMSAVSIYNLVRAITRPYLGAHAVLGDTVFKVWKVAVLDCLEQAHIEPGKVLRGNSEENALIRCNDRCIELIEIEPKIELKEGEYL